MKTARQSVPAEPSSDEDRRAGGPRAQIRRSLAALSYEEQLAAVAPSEPVQFVKEGAQEEAPKKRKKRRRHKRGAEPLEQPATEPVSGDDGARARSFWERQVAAHMVWPTLIDSPSEFSLASLQVVDEFERKYRIGGMDLVPELPDEVAHLSDRIAVAYSGGGEGDGDEAEAFRAHQEEIQMQWAALIGDGRDFTLEALKALDRFEKMLRISGLTQAPILPDEVSGTGDRLVSEYVSEEGREAWAAYRRSQKSGRQWVDLVEDGDISELAPTDGPLLDRFEVELAKAKGALEPPDGLSPMGGALATRLVGALVDGESAEDTRSLLKKRARLAKSRDAGLRWPRLTVSAFKGLELGDFDKLDEFEIYYEGAVAEGLDRRHVLKQYKAVGGRKARLIADRIIAYFEKKAERIGTGESGGGSETSDDGDEGKAKRAWRKQEDLWGPSEAATPTAVLSIPATVKSAVEMPTSLADLEPSGEPADFGWVEAMAAIDGVLSNDLGPLSTVALGVMDWAAARAKLAEDDLSDVDRHLAEKQILSARASVAKGTLALAGGALSTMVNAAKLREAATQSVSELTQAIQAGGVDIAAAGVGTVLSIVSTSLHLNKAVKAGKRRRRLDEIWNERAQQMEPKLREALRTSYNQSLYKEGYRAIAVVGGIVSTGAGIASGTALIATAAGAGGVVLMATPIGWALAATAATIGLGLLSYKIGRGRWKSYHRGQKADAIVAGLEKNNPQARAACEDLGFVSGWCVREVKKGRKDEIRGMIKAEYARRKERTAELIFFALVGEGTEDEQEDARRILIEGLKLPADVVERAEKERDSALVKLIEPKLKGA